MTCPDCGKPQDIDPDVFRQTPRGGAFVSLRQFLADYCTCDDPPDEP